MKRVGRCAGGAAEAPGKRPIRLMHVINVLSLAGMEYGVIKQVNRLDPDRFAASICCLDYQRDSTRALLDKRVPVFELYRREGRDLAIIKRLADLLRQECVDIVHSHNWPTFLCTVAAAGIRGSPLVIHGEHGRESHTVPGPRLVLSRLLARGVTHLITVNEHLRRELIAQWKVRPDRVTAIPNGVDLEAFGGTYQVEELRRELGFTPVHPIVMNTGGLRHVKDHPTLLRAFARVHQRHPQARLLLVGSDHGQGIQSGLERMSEDLGIGPAVSFIGIRHDIPQLLALCDVYVNSSVFEGMSNTILEAMAARKPVVATAVGGNPELVEDGLSGYLVPAGDDRQLADRLIRILDDKDLGRRMGAAGRVQVERDHPMSAMVEAYSDLYDEIWGRHHVRRKRSARELLRRSTAQGLYRSGLTKIGEHVGPARLTSLTYHRVLPLPEAARYPIQAMVMPRDLFESQIAYLAREFTVLPLADAVRLLGEGTLPRRAVAVTFDDGYVDNYQYAWPILRRYGIPATMFLVTGALDRKIRLWWDDVADDVQALSRVRATRRGWPEGMPSWLASRLAGLARGEDARIVARDVVRRFNLQTRQARTHALNVLRAITGPPRADRPDLMLTWVQVHEMFRSGICFGAHTLTHAFLDELDLTEAQEEIAGSVARLREELQAPVNIFAYPRGRVASHAQRVLRDVGITTAVTTEPGRNGPRTDRLDLKRLDAGYLRLDSGFDPALLEVEVQGWFARFRHA